MKKILAAGIVLLALAGCGPQKSPPSHPLGTSSEANIPGTTGYHSP